LIILAGAGAAFVTLRKDAPQSDTATGQKASKILLNNTNKPASKYNRSTELFAVGNLTYEPAKLQPMATDTAVTSALAEIKAVPKEKGLSGVAFAETGEDTYTRQLVMYDFGAKKTYIVHEDKGDQKVRHYYNPVILSDHYVAWYTLTYKTPVDLEGSISVADLNTGKVKVILRDTAGNLPESLCCSVSPDGLYLVVPTSPNKIKFYSVGGASTQEISVKASLLPQVEGKGNDNYAQAQRAVGYPALQWLDNERVVLATGVPIRYVVDQDGTHIFKDTNGLDVLNLATGQQTSLLKNDAYSIPWFSVVDNTVVFASHAADEDLSGGPITGNVNLYTLDTSSKNEPKILEGITHDKLGALVVDKQNQVLYIQEAAATPITAVSLVDGSRKTYSLGTAPLIEGALDKDTLIGGNGSGINSSTKLEVYTLSTGKTLEIL
jgi:hypothetical protein